MGFFEYRNSQKTPGLDSVNVDAKLNTNIKLRPLWFIVNWQQTTRDQLMFSTMLWVHVLLHKLWMFAEIIADKPTCCIKVY